MEPIQVEFTFNAAVFGKIQRYILWNFFNKGWLKWIVLAVVLIWILNQIISHSVLDVLIYVFVFGLFFGLWWLILSWVTKRNFTKNTVLQHPIRYVFSETDISLDTVTSKSVLQWPAFQQVTEAPEFFLLYQNKMAANPILKSGFHSEAEIARFRVLLQQKGLLK